MPSARIASAALRVRMSLPSGSTMVLLVGLRAGDHGIEELAHGNVLSHGYPALMIEHGPSPRTARPRGRFIYSVCMGFARPSGCGLGTISSERTPPERRRPIRINEYEGENPLWPLITPISAISPSKTTTPSLSAPVLPGLSVPGELAEEGGLRVLVIEKRAHIAGNMYDEYDEAGVLVHRYGPHIFHTNDKRAFDYRAPLHRVARATSTEVLADWYGTYMPVPFNKNSMEIAFGDEKARPRSSRSSSTRSATSARSPSTSCAPRRIRSSHEVADFVYQNVFLYYTQKQWGLTPEEVDPSVTARVPVFISRDNRYFQDAYQGMPVEGYTPPVRAPARPREASPSA